MLLQVATVLLLIDASLVALGPTAAAAGLALEKNSSYASDKDSLLTCFVGGGPNIGSVHVGRVSKPSWVPVQAHSLC